MVGVSHCLKKNCNTPHNSPSLFYLCHDNFSALSGNLSLNKLFESPSARKTLPKPNQTRVWCVHKNIFPCRTLSASPLNSTQPSVAKWPVSRLPKQDLQAPRPTTTTLTTKLPYTNARAPVVQKLDNTIHWIHWINHYPADSVVCFVNTNPLDMDLSSG